MYLNRVDVFGGQGRQFKKLILNTFQTFQKGGFTNYLSTDGNSYLGRCGKAAFKKLEIIHHKSTKHGFFKDNNLTIVNQRFFQNVESKCLSAPLIFLLIKLRNRRGHFSS